MERAEIALVVIAVMVVHGGDNGAGGEDCGSEQHSDGLFLRLRTVVCSHRNIGDRKSIYAESSQRSSDTAFTTNTEPNPNLSQMTENKQKH